MKKLNAYFPLWILIMVPPLLFLTLSFNFVMVAVGLLLVLIVIDKDNIFITYPKNVLKLWGVTLLIDLISFIVMLIPEFFCKIPFVKENIVVPLETNQYTNIFSIIYILILVLLNVFVIYKFIKKIIISKYKLETPKKVFTIFILILFMLPYLFFIPSNKIIKTEYNGLEDYRGVVMKNKSKIATILKYIESTDYISSYVIDTHAEPYTINIYLADISDNYQVMFEKDAAVLLNLIDDVNEVIFYLDGESYKYTINTINKIFNNVKKLKLNDIYNRYEDEKFENYTYLGHVNEYDIFDISEFCELDHQLLFAIENTEYYLSCTSVEQIMLYGDNTTVNIKEALNQNLITPSDIIDSTIKLIIEEVNTYENIS